MFKKPLSNVKTSAPLRNSDRKKLKQSIITTFNLTPEEGEVLVPAGVQSLKFSTHLGDPGVAYLDAEGSPLWITLGKGSEQLIPTIYTLWKKQDLLPFLSTPPSVMPVLTGGADLMIPGVIHCPPSLVEDQLVSVRQYSEKEGSVLLSAPLAVGRMAFSSEAIRGFDKGKAVLVVHTWKDNLWEMGSGGDPPTGTTFAPSKDDVADDSSESDVVEASTPPPRSSAPSPSPEPPESVSYTPQEVTDILMKALIQSISKTLKTLPTASYPISATILYTTYILPNRPAFPTLVHPPEGYTPPPSQNAPHVKTEITIKTSNHKSLTSFLKAAEKTGLLTLKPPQKQQPDMLITSVNGSHPLVEAHTSFATVKDIEISEAKKAAREEREREPVTKNGEVEIKEFWKPYQSSVGLFQAFGANTDDLYTPAQVQELVKSYIASNNLVNPIEQAYINLDDALSACLAFSDNSKGKNKNQSVTNEPALDFMRRDELVKGILIKMQHWYEVRAPGKDGLTKKGKGTLSPIQVVMKFRNGRKASTLITGFEPFLVIDAEHMAEELRKICAGSTAVNPIPGKAAGSGMEVFVQGKQSKPVVDFLIAKGIPKKWIAVMDQAKGKK